MSVGGPQLNETKVTIIILEPAGKISVREIVCK